MGRLSSYELCLVCDMQDRFEGAERYAYCSRVWWSGVELAGLVYLSIYLSIEARTSVLFILCTIDQALVFIIIMKNC